MDFEKETLSYLYYWVYQLRYQNFKVFFTLHNGHYFSASFDNHFLMQLLWWWSWTHEILNFWSNLSKGFIHIIHSSSSSSSSFSNFCLYELLSFMSFSKRFYLSLNKIYLQENSEEISINFSIVLLIILKSWDVF